MLFYRGMNEDVIANMRSRLERFRRLSTMITDRKAIEVLQQMAVEAEDDIKRLQARSGSAEPGS